MEVVGAGSRVPAAAVAAIIGSTVVGFRSNLYVAMPNLRLGRSLSKRHELRKSMGGVVRDDLQS
jgi:hypothetical protein